MKNLLLSTLIGGIRKIMSCSCIKYAFMSEKDFGAPIPKSVEYRQKKSCMEFLMVHFVVLAFLYALIAMSINGSSLESIHTRNLVLLLATGFLCLIMRLYFNAMQFKNLEQEMRKQKAPKTSRHLILGKHSWRIIPVEPCVIETPSLGWIATSDNICYVTLK